MNIILNQKDIEAALQSHLVAQGFALRNKSVTVDFSMRRGNNGLSASIDIVDVEIPGYTNVFPLIDSGLATGPSAEVKAMVDGSLAVVTTKPVETTVQPDPVATNDVDPEAVIPVVDSEVEVATTAPATLAEIEAVAVPEAVDPTAPVAEEAPTKTTTSLFG